MKQHPKDITQGAWYSDDDEKTLYRAFTSRDCEGFLNNNNLPNAMIQKCLFSGQFFVICYACKDCSKLVEVKN
jgi:hypothetical protein